MIVDDNACAEFLAAWGDSYLAGDVGTTLTCIEAEALAGMLSALGDQYAADKWISEHAEGDDCGDSHCTCEECKKGRD